MRTIASKKAQWAVLLGLLFAGGLMNGCATNNPNGEYPRPDTFRPGGSDGVTDKLRVGDLVRVEVRVPNPPAPHEEQIKEDGTITMYLIGAVQAADRTVGELQDAIRKEYERFYVRPVVVVRTADRVYTVGGEVRMPNRYAHRGPITLVEAIKSAGDFTDYANRRKVILRRADGTRLEVNARNIINGRAEDLPIYPGDSIHVNRGLFGR
jgi:polysaccharide biosynthesis/export protein